MTRVGIAIEQSGAQWTGGHNYFRNLLTAVNSRVDRSVELVLLAGTEVDLKGLDDLAETVRTPLLDLQKPARMFRKVLQRITHRDFFLEVLLKRHDIRMLSHSSYLGKSARIRSMPWIPDLQHVYLPNLFSADEKAVRDRNYFEYARFATAVLLSSHCAEKDFLRFVSPIQPQTYVLRFASCLAVDVEWPTKRQIMERYGLGERWFHLPNQFWAHKNHLLVIDALRIAKEQGLSFVVVATGNTEDLRSKEYFPTLMAKVQEYGLADSFIVAGMVPYADMMALMRYSVAVVNPSRFEGWSTSVEESRSLGKRILMSDIPVHREQAPERGAYFGLDDPGALAQEMSACVKAFDAEVEETLVCKALSGLAVRREAFALAYEAIVHQVLDA